MLLCTRVVFVSGRACQSLTCRHRCNLHQFSLLREADHFKFVEFLIDEFHFKNHKACSLNYSSGQYLQRAVNFSIAEQKNRPLKELAASLAHMDQVSFLKMFRFKLAAMNVYHLAARMKSSKHFWGAPKTVQRWQEQPVVESPDGPDDEDDDYIS